MVNVNITVQTMKVPIIVSVEKDIAQMVTLVLVCIHLYVYILYVYICMYD